MDKVTPDMGIAELGSYICSELEKNDIHVVLSGGACMEIYSSKFASYDIDLIERYSSQHKEILKTMELLGFKQEKKGKYFKHKNNPYITPFYTTTH